MGPFPGTLRILRSPLGPDLIPAMGNCCISTLAIGSFSTQRSRPATPLWEIAVYPHLRWVAFRLIAAGPWTGWWLPRGHAAVHPFNHVKSPPAGTNPRIVREVPSLGIPSATALAHQMFSPQKSWRTRNPTIFTISTPGIPWNISWTSTGNVYIFLQNLRNQYVGGDKSAKWVDVGRCG